MAYWHERVRPDIELVIPPADSGRTAIVVRRGGPENDRFLAHFVRWEGHGSRPATSWRNEPDGWFELYPVPPVEAATSAAAQEAARALLAAADAGEADFRYDRRPYVPPPAPERVESVEHPSGVANAVILRHRHDRFEVRYFSAVDFGGETDFVRTAVPGSSYWDEGGREVPWDTLTIADDLASAREAATLELARIVAAAAGGNPQDTFIECVAAP